MEMGIARGGQREPADDSTGRRTVHARAEANWRRLGHRGVSVHGHTARNPATRGLAASGIHYEIIPNSYAISPYGLVHPHRSRRDRVLGATPPPQPQQYDVIVRGGTVFDGTGSPGRRVDVGLRGDRIAGVGDFAAAAAPTVIDATGMAVAPGFINMLSWSTESLLVDGRSQGEIRQGVTTQIFGEGSSMGPLTDDMKKRMVENMGDLKYEITWTSLSEYLRDAAAAWHLARTWPPSSGRRRFASTSSASRIGGRRRSSSTRCARSSLGNGGRRARYRLVADLCAGVLCQHRRTDRAVQGCGAVPRQIHLAHAQRRKSPGRSRRRIDSHQP